MNAIGLSATLSFCVATQPLDVDAGAPLPEAVAAALSAAENGTPVIPDELKQHLLRQPPRVHELLARKMGDYMVAGPEHLRRLLSLELDTQRLELLLGDNCILCHSDPDQQNEATLLTVSTDGGHLDLREFLQSAHFRRRLSCAGCHGGAPTDTMMADEIYERWPDADAREKDRTWIPAFCARCHADPSVMRPFSPGMPTDQYEQFKTSRHGELLLRKADSKAAQCVSCHGAHGIQATKSPRSPVHPSRIADTCADCHARDDYMAGYTHNGKAIPTDQAADWKRSVHGRAVLDRGDLGAPACNDCHGDHAALPPDVSAVTQVCRQCHSAEADLFDASKHAEAFAHNGWPQCAQCHGEHLIVEPTDRMLANEKGTLCFDCHQEHAKDNRQSETMPAYFQQRLTELQQAVLHFSEESQRLAEKGLDTEPLDAALSEMSDATKTARMRLHGFDKATFDEAAAAGRKAIAQAEQIVESLRSDFRYRTAGLLTAVALMALLSLGLWLRIRDLERPTGTSAPPRDEG